MSVATASTRTLPNRPPVVRETHMPGEVPPVVSETGRDAGKKEGHITMVEFVITLSLALTFDLISFFGGLLAIAFLGIDTHALSSVVEFFTGVNVGAALGASTIIFLGSLNILVALGFFTWYAMKGLGEEAAMWTGASALIEFVPAVQALLFQNAIMVFFMHRRHRATLVEEVISAASAAAILASGGEAAPVVAGVRVVGTKAASAVTVKGASVVAGKKAAASAAEKTAVRGAATGIAEKEAASSAATLGTPEMVAGPSRARAYTQSAKDYATENLSSEALKKRAKEEIRERVKQKSVDAVVDIGSHLRRAPQNEVYNEEESDEAA